MQIDIYFKDEVDVRRVLLQAKEIASRYGVVSYTDFCDLAGVAPNNTVRTLRAEFNPRELRMAFVKEDRFGGYHIVIPRMKPIAKNMEKVKNNSYLPEIKDVIFNNPATIVLWADGTKTVVKCQKEDDYYMEIGLAMCIAKKALGNQGNFNDVFRRWIPTTSKEIMAFYAEWAKNMMDIFNRSY